MTGGSNDSAPHVVILDGPNGARKTTLESVLLPRTVEIPIFVSADTRASRLSGFTPDSSALAAGRLMLKRLHELASARRTFAFETTLASRSFAPFLADFRMAGYHVHVVYVWLKDAAVARVRERQNRGGHRVSEDVVRRRYRVGLENFFNLYRPLADSWRFYDNSGPGVALVAFQLEGCPAETRQPDLWQRLQRAPAEGE